MNELAGNPAELKLTLEIKRAATGETETVELVGIINGYGDDNNELPQEPDNS